MSSSCLPLGRDEIGGGERQGQLAGFLTSMRSHRVNLPQLLTAKEEEISLQDLVAKDFSLGARFSTKAVPGLLAAVWHVVAFATIHGAHVMCVQGT